MAGDQNLVKETGEESPVEILETGAETLVETQEIEMGAEIGTGKEIGREIEIGIAIAIETVIETVIGIVIEIVIEIAIETITVTETEEVKTGTATRAVAHLLRPPNPKYTAFTALRFPTYWTLVASPS